jgi:hypothetical protein
MKNDYLWDGSGEPDPEIQKLETALSQFRHKGTAPVFSETTLAFPAPKALAGFTRNYFSSRLAAAASILLAVGLGSSLLFRPAAPPEPLSNWSVVNLSGTPRVGAKVIRSNGASRLGTGQTLETDAASRAKLSVAELGELQVEPNTKLRVLRSNKGKEHIALDRGTIQAFIWAPPGDFVVDTPSATAVDLGCAYTLQVDDSGAGFLRTTLGWVGIKLNGHESFIPAGAVCATRPKVGPGTPYFEDAPESLRTALYKFDFAANTLEEQSAEIAQILAAARKRDALTLWHLLSRVNDSDRGQVYDKLASLVPPPSGVTREGVLHLNQSVLDLWWNALGHGEVSLWRTWERSWTSAPTEAK